MRQGQTFVMSNPSLLVLLNCKKKIVALDVSRFETTRNRHRSQLVSISDRKPSSGLMKIDQKRGDYIASRCNTLSNDQLNEL